mgnify:CR=1 FL=1
MQLVQLPLGGDIGGKGIVAAVFLEQTQAGLSRVPLSAHY